MAGEGPGCQPVRAGGYMAGRAGSYLVPCLADARLGQKRDEPLLVRHLPLTYVAMQMRFDLMGPRGDETEVKVLA